MWHVLVIPTQGRRVQEDPWESLDCQPAPVSAQWKMRTPALEKHKYSRLISDLQTHRHTCVHMKKNKVNKKNAVPTNPLPSTLEPTSCHLGVHFLPLWNPLPAIWSPLPATLKLTSCHLGAHFLPFGVYFLPPWSPLLAIWSSLPAT